LAGSGPLRLCAITRRVNGENWLVWIASGGVANVVGISGRSLRYGEVT
jgi:hypothetical protein